MKTRKAIEAERAWLAQRLRQKRHAQPFDPSIPKLEARIRRIDEAIAMYDYWRLKAS